MRIKHRPNLHSTEEAQEHIHREHPPDRLLAVLLQLVAAQVRVEDSNGIHIPKPSSHSAERSKDHEPGPQAAFGVLDVFLVGFLPGRGDGDEVIVVRESRFFILGVALGICTGGGLGTGGTRLELRA